MIALLFLVLLGRAAPVEPPQEELRREPPTAEGALANDCFLPVSDPAGSSLRSGDEALAHAREAFDRGQNEEALRLLESALENWHEALAVGGARASVWFDLAGTGSRRLSEGLRAAVLRRLFALPVEQRARWSARFEPSAAEALARALLRLAQPVSAASQVRAELRSRELELAAVERLYPLTGSAARAALLLCDLTLDQGLRERARSWLGRGTLHAESSGAKACLAALESRRPLCERAALARGEPWTEATSFALVDSLPLENRGSANPSRGAAPERGVRPGLVFLSDERAAVQTSEQVFLLQIGPEGALELARVFRPADLLAGFAPEPGSDPGREPPGWPLLPCAAGDDLVLVFGRGSEAEPNALLCIDPPRERRSVLAPGILDPASVPRLRWGLLGAERLDAALGSTPVPELADLGPLEFQPGPVIAADRVVVQAREYAGTVRAWLLAFDLFDGNLAWRCSIAAGGDLVPAGRFSTARRLSSQPLLALEDGGTSLVFAGTNLGAGGLFEALDGEARWTFKNRRRDPRDRGWSGARPPFETTAGKAATILWAPVDSDRLYALSSSRLEAGDPETAALLAAPPQELPEAEILLGGGPQEILVLGSAGRERTISIRRPGRDRVDALDLGPDERFRGVGLTSPTRAWVCTNRGVYLFDRRRELYLLDYESLPSTGSGLSGGELFPRGALVLVVGEGALWSLRAL